MIRVARVFAFAAVLLLARFAAAQEPMPVPKPGPEHERLNYFIGNWSMAGEAKPGIFGPGGKFTDTEHDEWLPGGFFVVAHSETTTPMGPEKEVAVMGYNTEERVYTYQSFSSMGQAESAKGTFENDTWTWTNESKMNGQMFKGRYTVKQLSSASYNFKFETSTDGKEWTTVLEGKATKVAAQPAKK